MIRTVLGDRAGVDGLVYAHEHLIIDSPLIEDRWPHILLDSVEDAVAELAPCRAAGVRLVVDAMPAASGRDAVRLADIARGSGVDVVAVTGLHHDRYYGPRHWSNAVGADALARLFVADLTEGIDRYDYTSPVVDRTPYRAGVVKVATSGERPDARDRRNLEAAARASVTTGCPVLTHCEDGRGAPAQVEELTAWGVPVDAIILSHVDKARDPGYAREVATTGAFLELDQNLRQADLGAAAPHLDLVAALVEGGFGDQIVLGTDGARRSLWTAHGGTPGLAWLATGYVDLLRERGLGGHVESFFHANPVRALSWRPI
ncbi:phosphotriesterase family protein [Propioniciclava coleopterorum]|nr:hypothetical protein [Propioniciclava coleopterorum]